MRDFSTLLFVLGVLLSTLSVAMAVPAMADLAVGNPDWKVFVASAATTLFAGVSLMLAFRIRRFVVSIRQTFILTTASWIVLTAFGALPFAFSGLDLSYADAYFEAMSGITTTGATVITGLDGLPPGILLWRSILQWLGGIGIIVMAVAILPFLRIGGMQLFRSEFSEKGEKALPRAAQLAASIAGIYFGLTIVWMILYWLAGMNQFDAVCHAMTTISTGGFSTYDSSVGHFDSAAIEFAGIGGMLAGSLPFVLYLSALQGHPRRLLADGQVRLFLGVVAGVSAAVAIDALLFSGLPTESAIRESLFNVVSLVTTTGYSTVDYSRWGGFALTIMFFLTFVGGCTGSTAGGIKIFRFQVLLAVARVQIGHLIRPHGVFVAHYNGKPLADSVTSAVLGFYFLFFVLFGVIALAMGLHGYDFITSVSAVASSLTNVGPGLGPVVGPAGSFASLDDTAKWLLSAAMLLGRLELFTVLVLFLPRFWRG